MSAADRLEVLEKIVDIAIKSQSVIKTDIDSKIPGYGPERVTVIDASRFIGQLNDLIAELETERESELQELQAIEMEIVSKCCKEQ